MILWSGDETASAVGCYRHFSLEEWKRERVEDLSSLRAGTHDTLVPQYEEVVSSADADIAVQIDPHCAVPRPSMSASHHIM